MSDSEQLRAKKIYQLHKELIGTAQIDPAKAVEIGELLMEQEGEDKYGIPIEQRYEFTERTAQQYKTFAQIGASLKIANVSGLTETNISGFQEAYRTFEDAAKRYKAIGRGMG
jgi:hypothetical protein